MSLLKSHSLLSLARLPGDRLVHVWLWNQLEIWATFIYRYWGSPSLALSFLSLTFQQLWLPSNCSLVLQGKRLRFSMGI